MNRQQSRRLDATGVSQASMSDCQGALPEWQLQKKFFGQTVKVLVLRGLISRNPSPGLPKSNRFEIVQTGPLCRRRFPWQINKQGGRDRSRPSRLTLRTALDLGLSQFIHLNSRTDLQPRNTSSISRTTKTLVN